MKTQMLNVDAVTTINYQFTAIPTNFIYLMDNDCFKLFSILLQKETYWNNKGKLNNGYFIKSISELSDELGLSNRKDVHTIIEALYIRNIIDVVVEARKYKTAKFKLNWDIINSYLDNSIYDLLEFEEKITKLNRNSIITYTNNDTKCNTINDAVNIDVTNNDTNIDTKCNTTIDNINNIDKKDNIYNNINKEEYNINIYKDKIEEVGLIKNPTSNSKEENIPMANGNGSDDEDEVLDMIFGEEEIIEENNTAFQLQYVGMQTKEEESMTEKFEKNLNTLLDKLNQCTSIQDLEDKVVKLCGWVERCSTSYTEEELETIKDRISDNYIANQTRIEKTEKIQVSMEEDFFNSVMLDSNAKTVNQVKKEKEEETTQAQNTITKEELENNINDFINSLPTYDDISMITTIANYITKKYDKAIREYGLMQLAMDMYTQIDAHKNANKSDLTDFNNRGIETTINDERTQEIASCEVVDECTNIEDCIASLIEDLEPAVLDSNETYIFETSTKLW